MSQVLKNSKLIVKKSPIHGYGVFADQDFQKGEVIEESYALLTPEKPIDLQDYLFSFDGSSCLALGAGSIFNHADVPNADYHFDPERQILVFESMRAIRKGDEILIHYGDKWFTSRKLTPINTSLRYRLKRPVMLAVRVGIVILLMTGLIGLNHYLSESTHFSFNQIQHK